MKKYLIASLLLSAGLSDAATISVGKGFGATSGIIPQTESGTLLTAGGYYIGVGTFTAVPTVTDAASLVNAVASFREFGSTTAATSGTTQGFITASVTAVPSTPADFNTREIFLVIGNAASKALSTEFAIIRGTPTWTFPGDTAAGGATALTVSSIGSIAPIAGTEVDAATDSLRLMSTVVVPEPGVSILALASLGLLARRRRN